MCPASVTFVVFLILAPVIYGTNPCALPPCTATGTGTPGGPPGPPHTMTQSIAFAGSITPGSYNGNTKSVYERAYAMSIHVWDSAHSAYRHGASVTSEAGRSPFLTSHKS